MSYSSSAAGKRFPPPALRVTRINRGQSGLDLAPGRTSSRQISLACLGPVGLGIPLYVSESRTTVAMRWLVRALGILFAAVVARGASVFGFSFVCGTLPECAAGPGVEASFLALGIAFVLSQIAGGLLFLYGFATVLAARLEFGPDHVRHVERARVFLSLTVVLLLVGFFAPFLLIPSSPPGTPAREPIFSVLAGPIPSAVAALFAGLVLLDILHRFSTHRDRLGLGAALVLGVAGAAVEGFSVYPGSGVLPASMVSLPLGLNLLSQAIVAASLLFFPAHMPANRPEVSCRSIPALVASRSACLFWALA